MPDCGNELSHATGWFNPCAGIGTPDLLSCSAPNTPGPGCHLSSANCGYNTVGNSATHSGEFMIGLHIVNQNDAWGEYASIALRDSLIPGQQYYVEYYVSADDGNTNCGPQILFSTDTMPWSWYYYAEPQIYNGWQIWPNYSSTQTDKWDKISGVFTADSAYKFLTIGNFFHLSDPRQALSYPEDTNYLLINFFVDDVKVLPVIKPYLGPDKVICDNDSLMLDAGVEAASYIWSTGDTTRTIVVHKGGMYWCGTGNEARYMSYDTMYIAIIASPAIDLGPDSAVCSSEVLHIPVSPGRGFLRYDWLPSGSQNDSLYITAFGTYSVTVLSENGCRKSDTISVYENCPDCLTAVAVYPNPVRGAIAVQFASAYDYPGTSWHIYDAIGQLCDRGLMEIRKGDNEFSIALSVSLASGAYILALDVPCRRNRLVISVVE